MRITQTGIPEKEAHLMDSPGEVDPIIFIRRVIIHLSHPLMCFSVHLHEIYLKGAMGETPGERDRCNRKLVIVALLTTHATVASTAVAVTHSLWRRFNVL